MRAKLLDTDNDPGALRDVKSRAQKAMPKVAFSRKVKVHYIKAGPGCGKSYVTQLLADENDLIVAPFTKLKTDYKGLRNARGEKYNLNFKTTHRAMETKGHARIFVDEFTSFPYEFLACVVQNNAADEVF